MSDVPTQSSPRLAPCLSEMDDPGETSPTVQGQSSPSLRLCIIVRRSQSFSEKFKDTVAEGSVHRSAIVDSTVALIRGYILSHVLHLVKARVTDDRRQDV